MLLIPLLVGTLHAPPTPKVLIAGIDGLRADAITERNGRSLRALANDGWMVTDAFTSAYTVSGPGWSNILCGVWPDKHRVVDNKFTISDYEQYPSIFTLAKRVKPTLKTASIADWLPIDNRILKDAPIDYRVAIDGEKDQDGADESSTQEAERIAHDTDADLIFFYLGNVDSTGHNEGFHRDTPQYRDAISVADQRLNRVVTAIQQRPTFADEDWLIICTTDHGGTVDRNHGRNIPEHRTIPFIVSGKAARHGAMRGEVSQVDVVPTALAHLGIALDPKWDLDGRAVGLGPAPDAASLFGRNLIENPGGDAQSAPPLERLVPTTKDQPPVKEIVDRGVLGWRDLGSASILAYGSTEGGPAADTPGADGSRNYFWGGDSGESRLSQRIDVTPLGHEIDLGEVSFELAGRFGGFADQRDLAWLDVSFRDEHGGEVGTARLAAVTLADRLAAFSSRPNQPAGLTGFLERNTRGTLPGGTRVIEVTLRFERASGVCDGYADALSLVLQKGALPPHPHRP